MPTQTLFKDLCKRSNDLLNKDFGAEKGESKIEWKGATSTSASLETTITQKADNNFVGVFTPKYKVKEWGSTFSAEIKTNRDLKLEASMEDQSWAQGLKTTVSGEAQGEEMFGTVGVEYKHEVATVTGSVDYGRTAGSTAKATGVVGNRGFFLGASVNYFLGEKDSSLKELHAQLGYTTEEFDVAGFGKLQNESSSILGASFYHRTSNDLQFGGEVTFDTVNMDQKPKLSLGCQYRLDDLSSLKTKFDTLGKLGLSWQQTFSKNAKLTLSGAFDLSNLSKPHYSTFGLNLSLS